MYKACRTTYAPFKVNPIRPKVLERGMGGELKTA
ncbi:hypothetical protein IMSAGC002_03895 [Lachnospiraceae bacterium]|nr:hypothetical protein IMSAGC002_03895 [Lachnospiraceae bacterium]